MHSACFIMGVVFITQPCISPFLEEEKTSLDVNLCWKWKDVGVLIHALTKIIGKVEEKDRKFPPIFSKWEYFCQNWRIIFVSVCYLHVHSLFYCLLAHAYKQCLHFDWLFYCHLVFINIISTMIKYSGIS